VGIVWALIAIHLSGRRGGFRFNDLATVFKVAGIVVIVILAFAIGRGSIENFQIVSPVFEEMSLSQKLAGFGTSLIFVMFCYSGWNASAYVAGEMENPQRDLPRSLLAGTAAVLLLYLAMNAVYFYGARVTELAGKAEVGIEASTNLFGNWGAGFVTVIILVSLIASASAMTIAGPRVYYALGRDYQFFSFLSATGRRTSAPTTALLLQGIVTSIIIVSGRIDQIQQYTGFTLTLFASIAVSCVITLRVRRPEMPRPFRTWGYPATPLLFIVVSVWMMVWAFQGRPVESSLSLATVIAGGMIFYMFVRR
jgi:APA family basic amino acid/polyamine antiporter